MGLVLGKSKFSGKSNLQGNYVCTVGKLMIYKVWRGEGSKNRVWVSVLALIWLGLGSIYNFMKRRVKGV